MITYYITGATGHLGRSIINELLKNEFDEDFNIVALILPGDKNIIFNDPNHKINFVQGNILNEDDVNNFLSTNRGDLNYLIHCAGLISIYKKKDQNVTNVNVNGTKILLDKALFHNFTRFIYVSSVDAIPPVPKGQSITEPEVFDENLVSGVYGKSKAQATKLVLSYNDKHLETITIHPSALFGPNDFFMGPINKALVKFINGELKTIVTGGYDVVDVRDVSKGILNATKIGKPNSSYILSGYPITIKDLINSSSKISNKPSYLLCLNSNFVKIFAPLLEMISKIRHQKPLFTAYSMACLNQNYNYSSSKAINEINYKIRPLEDSLSDTFEWFSKVNWIKNK